MTRIGLPLHVAVPLPTVAEVGAASDVPPFPAFVTVIAVPPAMMLVPVSVTVAVAPVMPVKAVSKHVWPMVPVVTTPDVRVPERSPCLRKLAEGVRLSVPAVLVTVGGKMLTKAVDSGLLNAA